MASGRLGTASLAATTNTTLYICPASTLVAANCNLVNRTGSAVTVRLAVTSSDTPGDAEWIEYGTPLAANGVLERTGIVLAAGQRIVAYASATGVSATCWGIEEAV